MLFREYKNVKPVCLCCESAELLEYKIERLGERYDIIDLQFSTHFEQFWKEEKFCALLLVAPKGELDER